MNPINFVCWKWKPLLNAKIKPSFTNVDVNRLNRMLKRHMKSPFTLTCVGDEPEDLEPDIRFVPLWEWGTPWGKCYTRLYAFSNEAKELLGERFVSIDLDCVVVGDLTPLFQRDEPFVIWKSNTAQCPYNGSLWMHSPGTMTYIHEEFDKDPGGSADKGRNLRYNGSDQAWFAARCGLDLPVWTHFEHGVSAFKQNCIKYFQELPESVKIVFFPGQPKPVMVANKYKWVKDNFINV